MSIDLSKYLAEAFSQPQTKQFIKDAEAIAPAPDAPFKSWIGINFTPESLESVKVYYTWYQDLHPSPVQKLLAPAHHLDFFDRYAYRHEAAVLNSVEFGSGFTVSLRVDRRGPAGYAFRYRIAFDPTEELAEDPLLLEFGRVPHLLPGMGHYPLQHDDDCCLKRYHYFDDPEFSQYIQESHFPFPLPPAPTIEYGIGPFSCELEKAPEDCRRKVILRGNYDAISDAFLAGSSDWPMVQSIQALCHEKGLVPRAPGRYIDEDVWSLYLFPEDSHTSEQHLHTLRRFISNEF